MPHMWAVSLPFPPRRFHVRSVVNHPYGQSLSQNAEVLGGRGSARQCHDVRRRFHGPGQRRHTAGSGIGDGFGQHHGQRYRPRRLHRCYRRHVDESARQRIGDVLERERGKCHRDTRRRCRQLHAEPGHVPNGDRTVGRDRDCDVHGCVRCQRRLTLRDDDDGGYRPRRWLCGFD